jgi:hypothetical protein
LLSQARSVSLERLAEAKHCLADEIAQFANGGFVLQAELENLERVRQAEAVEAVIFYCGRALEALSRMAVAGMNLAPAENTFSNLQLLEQYGLLHSSTRYWAHGLRRMTNDIRHVLRPVNPPDAELALLYTERWLEWFFCAFPLGPRMASMLRDGSPLLLASQHEWRGLIDALSASGGAKPIVQATTSPTFQQICQATPAIWAIVGESLIDADEATLAREVMDAALAQFPANLRLRQIQGLAWSRCGMLDEARVCLERLKVDFPDDEETTGILAGVYKRLWQRDVHQRQWLARSHTAYREGWKRSRKQNAYLGINAATTALWLGDASRAQELAAQIRDVLRARRDLVSQASSHDPIGSYWDDVTLAEAELLLGDWDAAKASYGRALAGHARQRGNIAVTRDQARQIVAVLDPANQSHILRSLFPEGEAASPAP